jgi:hypothetical protein
VTLHSTAYHFECHLSTKLQLKKFRAAFSAPLFPCIFSYYKYFKQNIFFGHLIDNNYLTVLPTKLQTGCAKKWRSVSCAQVVLYFYPPYFSSLIGSAIRVPRRKIRLIEDNAHCRHLKILPCCKGTLRQVVSVWCPLPIPLTHCIYIRVYSILIYTGKGGESGTREKVRGAIVHKAGSKIRTWLNVSPVYKLW